MKIAKFEFENHGIDMPFYFQGSSAMFTEYEEVIVGVGISEKEAADDAVEQLCQITEINQNSIKALEKEIENMNNSPIDYKEYFDTENDEDDPIPNAAELPMYYVSLLYTMKK